jgi:exodeoxyribonuclease-3
MRILSWNVNGIRSAEKKGLLDWIRADSPDVLCLQETKARPDQLSEDLHRPLDAEGRPYFSFWASAQWAGYSGTAIYSRAEPLGIKLMGIPAFDSEGRFIQADYPGFALLCAYFPNSQDSGARLGYKLDFCAAILEYCQSLVRQGRHLILCGDYNIAHTPIDLARAKENEGNAGYLPEERAWMDLFTASGFADSFRRFHPGEAGHYSWWSYRAGARGRNVGWRLDYHCVDEGFLPQVRSALIRPEVNGSDHCPVQIDLL